MTDPRELQAGDVVSIDLSAESADSGENSSGDESDTAEPLSDLTFRVSDTEVTDIGITETIAVTLVSDADEASNYALVGTTADSAFTLEEIDGDDEVRVTTNAIVLE
jgi:methionine aminopeptidase